MHSELLKKIKMPLSPLDETRVVCLPQSYCFRSDAGSGRLAMSDRGDPVGERQGVGDRTR